MTSQKYGENVNWTVDTRAHKHSKFYLAKAMPMATEYKYPHIAISNLSAYLAEHQNETELTFIVKQMGFDFPVRVRRGRSTNFLIAHYNGAVDRKRSPSGIVFQRSTWRKEIDCDAVYFADPTLLPHANLTIGWGQMSEDQWGIDGYVRILKIIRNSLSIAPPWRTIHYSSSAGGFQAIATATLDRGSYAVANNPQIDIQKYNPVHQRRLFKLVFNDTSGGSRTVKNSPWRFNLVELFEKESRVPRLKLAINVLSPTDYRNQVMHFLNQLDQLSFTPKSHIRIDFYYDEKQGHKPLSRIQTKRLLKEEQARICSLNTPHSKLPRY